MEMEFKIDLEKDVGQQLTQTTLCLSSNLVLWSKTQQALFTSWIHSSEERSFRCIKEKRLLA